MCVPPGPDGTVPDVVLAAAAIAGAHAVHPVGGAQAIAALAYGTESIPAVDVIVGPGNVYVAVAKREVAGEGRVGVPVGLRRAVGGRRRRRRHRCRAAFAAIDVVVQAEHGPDGLAWLVTWDEVVAKAVEAEVAGIVAGVAPAGRDRGDAGDVAASASSSTRPRRPSPSPTPSPPSTSSCCARAPRSSSTLVRHAGAVFCGPLSTAAIGDYFAGPSHVLPTFGSARFAGALTPDDFTKPVHVVDRRPRRASPPPPPTSSPWPRPRGSSPTPTRSACGEDAAVIEPRDDVALMEGYHSPQVDGRRPPQHERGARAAAAGVRRRARRARAPTSTGTATPTAAPPGCGPAPRRPPRRRPGDGVRRQRLERGAADAAASPTADPGRAAAVFEPTYALHSHIARITGTDGGDGRAHATTSPSTSTR